MGNDIAIHVQWKSELVKSSSDYVKKAERIVILLSSRQVHFVGLTAS